MEKKVFKFSKSSTEFYFAGGMSQLKTLADPKGTVVITDENIFQAHEKRFKGWNTIVLKAGEEYKIQATVDAIVESLIEWGAGRNTKLVGIGGGVITDLTGYVASIYMRGISFGFVPTSILSLVDASIGGKNGIDVGVYKNMLGSIRQPNFILHDMIFLNSLPETEWINGFAEIIKHASIKDAIMFKTLEMSEISDYQKSQKRICELIQQNANIKIKVVQKDEFEKGDRKLLNFGHTLGHALENQYQLSHGHAISIGMTFAAKLSEKLTGFKETDRLANLLSWYKLPTYASFDKEKAFSVLTRDKKKAKNDIHFVLLDKIGKGIVKPVSLKQLEKALADF